MATNRLIDEIARKGGIAKACIVILSGVEPEPRHTPYLDLLSTHGVDSSELLPDAVIEQDGFPIMYLLDRGSLGGNQDVSPQQLGHLLNVLASRGDARLLGVIHHGTIEIHPIMFTGSRTLEKSKRKELPFDGSRPILRDFLEKPDREDSVPSDELRGGETSRRWLERANHAWLEGLLFRLLDDAADAIIKARPNKQAPTDSDILSLIGRALFVRFLVDREIIKPDMVGRIAKGAMDRKQLLNEKHVANTFAWLDKTFNGDLLALGEDDWITNGKKKRTIIEGVDYYLDYFEQLSDKVKKAIFNQLANVLNVAEREQLPLFWGDIQFRHVPADLLSQVYERFYRTHNEKEAKKTSANYTPRRLAAMVMNGCFSAMESSPPHKAKILDPSAGGGVFLSLALRRLVMERWKKDKKRPDRMAIRQILHGQVFGFDVNKDALKVAALGLYLTALELDPDPHPPDALKFDCLFGENLHEFGKTTIEDGMGSLSEDVREKFTGIFDIVAGNPPWTPWSAEMKKPLTALVRGALKRQVGKGRLALLEKEIANYESYRHRPDTAFVWRATEWAKKGGGVGFLLHSRLLFEPKIKNISTEREYLFRIIQLTGVMDGSRIHQDQRIWPNKNAPFILMVAKNRCPDAHAAFNFLSINKEKSWNDVGRFRVDSRSTHPIPVSRVFDTPHLLKTLMRGSALDVDLVSRLAHVRTLSLNHYLSELGTKFLNGACITLGGTKDATFMLGKPLLTTKNLKELHEKVKFVSCINADKVPPSPHKKMWRAPDPKIRPKPLLLFREKAAADRSEQGALYSNKILYFNESFYGASFHGVEDGLNIVKYLVVVSFSRLFFYYLLMTSAKFGVERRAIYLEDYENFPIIPYASLTEKQKKDVAGLADEIEAGHKPWNQIDELVANIYKLSNGEQDLVRDAYDYELPFAESLKRSEKIPDSKMIEEYCRRLKEVIAPSGKVDGQDVKIEPVKRVSKVDVESPWQFIRIGIGSVPEVDEGWLKEINWAAQPLDVSQIHYWPEDKKNNLIIGQLAQARYWTRSRAWRTGLDWRIRLKASQVKG